MRYLLMVLATFAGALWAQGSSTGQVPLMDLGTNTYSGFTGGLYPAGSNARPATHDASGLAIAQGLSPLDAAGNPSATGKIVMVSLGMSHTTHESQALLSLLPAETGLNPQWLFVDGAEGGMTAVEWADPGHSVWTLFGQKLQAAGSSLAQVQMAWVKLTMRANELPSGFPADAQFLQARIKTCIQNLKAKCPNVKIAFLTDRSYAGYATTQLNPEPIAYRTGFALKWLIEEQINAPSGDLGYQGAAPQAPWLAWGPSLWADGLGSDGVLGGVPGRSDGLEWQISDFGNDGTHLTTQGRLKAAQRLLDFLKTDSVASTLVLAAGSTPPPPAPSGSSGGSDSSGGCSTGAGESLWFTLLAPLFLLLALRQRAKQA